MNYDLNLSRLTDALGVGFRYGDIVTVVAYGSPVRLIDVGRKAEVIGFTHAGNIKLRKKENYSDPIAGGRAVSPGMLAIARRDGKPGHEGNRTCTCGAQDFEGCFCGLSPKQFYASPHVQKMQQAPEPEVEETQLVEVAPGRTGFFEGNLTEGDVIVKAEDWALIQDVVRSYIGLVADQETATRLLDIKVSSVEMAEA